MPVVTGYLEKIGDVTGMIQKQIRFTQDYQNIGSSEPRWHNIDERSARQRPRSSKRAW